MRLFLTYAAFLMVFFSSLTMYQRLILGEYSISYIPYGSNLIQALILSKIILLGETLHLGERYADKPLIIPTLYKTVIFSFFVLVFTVIERFFLGYVHGIDFNEILQKFLSEGIDEILARVLVIFLFFILFFAFIETSRVFGEGKLFNLFFRR